MNMIAYSPVLLTYFDILGFRATIASNRSVAEIARILSVFTRISAPSSETGSARTSFLNFSDLVIRTTVVADGADSFGEDVYWELLDIAYIQTQLAQDGIFVRGVVTFGDIHIREKIVFGPALIRGYELERAIAIYPRVIVDSTVIDRMRRTPSTAELVDDACCQDFDGISFVDYLRVTRKQEYAGQDTTFSLILRQHGNQIRKISTKGELSAITQKVGWLARYHNSVVDEVPGSGEKLRFALDDHGSRTRER